MTTDTRPSRKKTPVRQLDFRWSSPGTVDTRCALVIAAHNEEAVLAETLMSALGSYAPMDVFVFSDGSIDGTVEIARALLPAANVVDHPTNIGKSRGIQYVLEHHVYPGGYPFVTILDADTTLADDFKAKAVSVASQEGVAGVVGQIKSRWSDNVFAVYRTYLYWLWQAIFKRLQNSFNGITIAAGTSTTWRTDALREIQFDHRVSTEDFEMTSQTHRKGLGRLVYEHKVVVHTQDPFSFRGYWKQTFRWSRAWWETVRKHGMGARWFRERSLVPATSPTERRGFVSWVDVFIGLFMASSFAFFAHLMILPVLLLYPPDIDFYFAPDSRTDVLIDLAAQLTLLWLSIVAVAFILRKPRMILYSPAVLVLVLIEFTISMLAFASTVRSLYRRTKPGAATTWTSPERRPTAPLGSRPRTS